ncbi:MAG TPA: M48 family metallopeptidase [Bdellovibrionota bacterium]|jgi:predicted Zn-dependent protease
MKKTNPLSKKFVSLSLLTALLLPGCAHMTKEPSDAEINAEAAKAYAEVKSKSKVSTNAEWTAMVNRVAKRIADSSGVNYQWEWVLLENPEPNAWCMPGGKMAVYTGIMPILKTEGALAAVLGHEVAHATRSHGKQRYARAMTGNMIALGVGVGAVLGGQLLCKTKECKLLTALGGAAAGFAVAFFDRKFSRGDETEADQYGQVYMAKAGYEPAESIKLWERMGAATKGKAPPEWLSTHPSDETRRNNLTAWLPNAAGVYQHAPVKYGTGAPIVQ